MYQDETLKEYLIRTGKAKTYLQQRKKYIEEETTTTTALTKNGIKNFLIDVVNHGYIINGKPARPEYFGLTKDELDECEKIRNQVKQQVKRAKKHIAFLMTQPDYALYFITLTFTDQTLETTSAETRKQKVRRALSQATEDFIANIDYSPEKHREHYHAIIALPLSENLTKDKKGHLRYEKLSSMYDYGTIDIKAIRTSKTDNTRLSRYMNKLALHSYKVNQEVTITKRGTRWQHFNRVIIPSLKKDGWRAIGEDDQISHLMDQANKLKSLSTDEKEITERLNKIFPGYWLIEEEEENE